MRNEDVVSRAFAAYFRAGGQDRPALTSGERVHEGKRYVVLESDSGTLAVYRVRPSGVLKGMRRWPKEIEGGA
jgi:hypothetical protein